MELIRKTGSMPRKFGKGILRLGLFYCSYCKQKVEKSLYDGKNYKSCGCAVKQLQSNAKKTHNDTKNPLYWILAAIKQRCLNSNNQAYKNYGARGISICKEWLEYIPFRNWALANGYKKGLTIDRKDNDGNYEPNNCRWATRKTNNRNTRVVKLTIEKAREIRKKYATGKYYQKQLADEYNIDQTNISNIILFKTWREE